MKGDDCRVIYRIHDWSFELTHELEVVVILDVVALADSDLTINDHEFGMESTQHRSMIVDDLEVEIGQLLRWWDLYLALQICILCGTDVLMVANDLTRIRDWLVKGHETSVPV